MSKKQTSTEESMPKASESSVKIVSDDTKINYYGANIKLGVKAANEVEARRMLINVLRKAEVSWGVVDAKLMLGWANK